MSIEILYLWYIFYEVIKVSRSFGEKIRSLREESGINQTELGMALNMTQRKISYIETGKYEPSISDIVSFCTFFKVSSDYLLAIPQGYKYPIRK